jgi:putative ABC transport system permease protein
VVLSSEPSTERLTAVDVRVDRFDGVSGEPVATQVTRVPAQVLYVRPEVPAPLLAVLPSALARKAHVPTGIVELQLAHPDLSREQEKDLTAALGALAVPGSVYVERGYQTDQATAIIQWVLAGLGAVLMLGGTLTATFLALSDARPDLATLAAVGAAPRTRRGVGAAYALVVGLVGAALGALVGAVPGVAVTYPLTVRSGETCVVTAPGGGCTAFGSSGPFLDVPWLLIGVVVVGLPVATALVVGLCTRSRLPMAARLS